MFWPKEVWGRYARRLDAFKAPENAAASLGCLNELVTDALRHAPHSLAYMAMLRNRDVFRFCAIPQVMAIGTLALCYNNRGVFTGVAPLPHCVPGADQSDKLASQIWRVFSRTFIYFVHN